MTSIDKGAETVSAGGGGCCCFRTSRRVRKLSCHSNEVVELGQASHMRRPAATTQVRRPRSGSRNSECLLVVPSGFVAGGCETFVRHTGPFQDETRLSSYGGRGTLTTTTSCDTGTRIQDITINIHKHIQRSVSTTGRLSLIPQTLAGSG